MRTGSRKSAPGVRDGKVKKKNRTSLSPDIYVHDQESLVIHRIRPTKGYRHAVSGTDVRRFVALIPDWNEVAGNVRAIVLTPGGDYAYGRYNNVGIIKLDAWPKAGPEFIPERKLWLLDAMNVPHGEPILGSWELELSPSQVRCFLLLGTFLHELGHHVDRMSTKSKRDASNGEPFAIRYELRRQRELWAAYCREFGSA